MCAEETRFRVRANGQATPVIVTLGTFGSYVWFGNDLDPQTAFTALTLLNILRFPLVVLPNIITSAIEASVSLKRVGRFLSTPELGDGESDGEYNDIVRFCDLNEMRPLLTMAALHPWLLSRAGRARRRAAPSDPGVALEVRRGDFYWDDDLTLPALRDVSLSLPRGALCGVVGGVGSGKTALVRALIGDLQRSPAASVRVRGSVAYAAQEPWILNATLRENVVFGSGYDERWYNEVVDACALRSDFEILPAGDRTEIGACRCLDVETTKNGIVFLFFFLNNNNNNKNLFFF